MSVKRTVRGSVSGYLSDRAMAMSSRSSQSKLGGIFLFLGVEIFISGNGILDAKRDICSHVSAAFARGARLEPLISNF
jgi:hypothetical protein